MKSPDAQGRARVPSALGRGAPLATATRWVVRLSWAYLAVAAIMCGILWTLSDRWWPATLLLFGPRWVLLLPLAALVPAAIKIRASLLLPLAAGAVIVVVPVMGLRLGWRSEASVGGASAPLRVVTLNTDGMLGPVFDLGLLLEQWGAHIVALQECRDVLQDAIRRVPGWHSHAAGQICVLSRHPIRETGVARWSDLAGARRAGIGGTSQAASYLIDAPQGPIRFVNIHLETARKGLEGVFELDVRRITPNTVLRDVESRRTRNWVGSAEPSVIVAGDFNTPVESRIYRRDWSEFRNAFSEAGVGFGMTMTNRWTQVRIDHVLTGAGWRAKRVIIGPDVGAEHRPVIADLTWIGRRGAPSPPSIKTSSKNSDEPRN